MANWTRTHFRLLYSLSHALFFIIIHIILTHKSPNAETCLEYVMSNEDTKIKYIYSSIIKTMMVSILWTIYMLYRKPGTYILLLGREKNMKNIPYQCAIWHWTKNIISNHHISNIGLGLLQKLFGHQMKIIYFDIHNAYSNEFTFSAMNSVDR